MDPYDPKQIEPKWQQVWADARAFATPDPEPGEDRSRKSYVLEMLPYPSGTLHMGHILVYTIGDVLTHFRRRNGLHVLRPMGYDSFGLPAENAAIREGGHPRAITERNIAHIGWEFRRLGYAFDWDREISSHRPDYYRWTQWLFLKLYEAGLAYRKEAPVNWCPKDQAVLANEQVHDGRCEYCKSEVESKILVQWFFRTTAYAQQMLDELDGLDWPERALSMQRHWIGRSKGADITFQVAGGGEIEIFTTRPDTLFGATFFVLAPEHPLVGELVAGRPEEQAVLDYVRRTASRTAVERMEAEDKTGVFTGRHVINPASGEEIPVWVADYVLMDYGTGAIMAVPAHDERDFAFATTHGLGIRRVIDGPELPHSEPGQMVDSGEFTGLPSEEGKAAVVSWLSERGVGSTQVRYRLRDWLLSRQRYWGCPIPIVYCEQCGETPVPEADLPVPLPEIEDYLPKGQSPLAADEEWVSTTCPACGGPARREADTMDTFVDSSWYFLRYCDPNNDQAPFDREIVDYWLPVDHYTGGVDHVTMHMIYARFFVKALNDLGLVGFREPFQKFFGNGWVQLGGTKMSKSRGNVMGPDELIERYGADPLRLYMLFIGPADQDMEWTEGGIEGMNRFVRRLWRVVHEAAPSAPSRVAAGDSPLARKAHQTIAKVSDDIGRRESFNTAIAAVMELVNELSRDTSDPAARFAAETAVSLIQPYAPHLAEELWSVLGHERLWEEPWPSADPAMLERDEFELVVQVNGKVRDRIQAATALSDDELVELAKASSNVQAHLASLGVGGGKEIRKAVVVPRKLVNLVV